MIPKEMFAEEVNSRSRQEVESYRKGEQTLDDCILHIGDLVYPHLATTLKNACGLAHTQDIKLLFCTVMMQFARYEKSYDPTRPILPYLYKIARNAKLKHSKREIQDKLFFPDSLRGDNFQNVPAKEVPLYASFLVHQVLQRLSSLHQEVLWTKYAEGYTDEEIAEVLNLSTSKIKRCVRNATKEFRKLIGLDQDKDPPESPPNPSIGGNSLRPKSNRPSARATSRIALRIIVSYFEKGPLTMKYTDEMLCNLFQQLAEQERRLISPESKQEALLSLRDALAQRTRSGKTTVPFPEAAEPTTVKSKREISSIKSLLVLLLGALALVRILAVLYRPKLVVTAAVTAATVASVLLTLPPEPLTYLPGTPIQGSYVMIPKQTEAAAKNNRSTTGAIVRDGSHAVAVNNHPRDASQKLPVVNDSTQMDITAFSTPYTLDLGKNRSDLSLIFMPTRAGTNPVVSTVGVGNSAAAGIGTPVAPGSLIKAYGFQLALQASAVSLRTKLGNVQVQLDDEQLLFLDEKATRIRPIVPIIDYEIPVNTGPQLVVQNGSQLSPPGTLTFAPILFTDSLGQAIAINASQNSTPVTSTAPAQAGDELVFFSTGLGPAHASTPIGDASAVASQTLKSMTMTIGGQPATLAYDGLSGSIGLYQLRVIVPAGAGTGTVLVVVTQGGVITQATVALK